MTVSTLSIEKPIGHTTLEDILRTAAWIQHELSLGLEPYGITWVQWNVLQVLYRHAPHVMRSSDIGKHLQDRTSDITRLLDRIERNGWIVRKRAAHDKRIVNIALSEEGLRLLERAKAPVEKLLDVVSGTLNTAEQMLLSDYLDRIRERQ